MLSYSFSVECPNSQRQSFLQQAREAFSIGLLTNTEGKQVTSKQELHTVLKAAFSLTVTHKWLGTPQKVVTQATQACHKALANFYDYCHADNQDKDSLCAEIVQLVAQVKLLLRVEPFFNSDRGSFIPDSYRNISDTSVNFTLAGFSKLMQRFQKYHASLCETTDSNCKGTKDDPVGARLCLTALGTTMDTPHTECSTEACKVAKGTPQGEEPRLRGSDSSAGHPPQQSDQSTTQGSTDELGSSWQNFSLSGSGSSWPSSSGYVGSSATGAGADARNQNCPTTEDDDSMLLFPDKNMKRDLHVSSSIVKSHTVPSLATPATSPSNVSSDSEKFEESQAGIETLATEDWMTDAAGGVQKTFPADGEPQSLSQLILITSSSSLGDSFGSQSSWEQISTDLTSPTNRIPQLANRSKAGTIQTSKSSESDGSFLLLETLDSETTDSGQVPTNKEQISGRESRLLSKPQNVEMNVDPNMDTETDSVSVKPAAKSSLATPHPKLSQCSSTEASTGSSFDIVEMNEVSSTEKVNVPQRKSPLCYSCLNQSPAGGVVGERPYLLSQTDYQALLAGVCHDCLMKRLHSDETQFKLKEHSAVYSKYEVLFRNVRYGLKAGRVGSAGPPHGSRLKYVHSWSSKHRAC